MRNSATLWCLYGSLVAMAIVQVVVSLPESPSDKMNMTQIMNYFTYYQYMGKKNPDPQIASLEDPDDQLKEAVMMFQRNWGLKVTGKLTEEMVELMSKPRCGVADINIMEDTRRKKRYAAFSKYDHTDITYRISIFPRDYDLTNDEVADTIQKAFDVWAAVSPLTFTRKQPNEKVDIDIQFGSYQHGDYYPFDGPDGYLAHAFFPPVGDTHFDDSETWTLNTNNYNLYIVAVHEFGHALGLGHNTYDRSAIMFPNYQYVENLQLGYDDILGIQALYGLPPDMPDKPPTRPPVPDPTVPPTDKGGDDGEDIEPEVMPGLKAICEDPHLDAMTYIVDDENPQNTGTYGFKGAYYMVIGYSGYVADGYPRRIRDDWPGIPDDIDAVLYWPDTDQDDNPAMTLIFKGDKYWALKGKTIMQGYPKDVSDFGIPRDIDAAFVWNKNGKTYFVKGDEYYRYSRGVGADPGFPRNFEENWVGIPSDIDAAFQWDNLQTYFFKGNDYWKFDDSRMEVAYAYPRLVSRSWFRCQRIEGLLSDKENASNTLSVGPLVFIIMIVSSLLYLL